MIDYRIATLNDIDLLTTSRIEVLRAANKLDDSVDMTEVERESRVYYEKALAETVNRYLTVSFHSRVHLNSVKGVCCYVIIFGT